MRITRLRLAIICAFACFGTAVVSGSALATTIDWSGYTWTIKNGSGLGPGPNEWSDSSRSVYVDGRGRLHLKIRKINNVWTCSQVFLSSSLGYGTYDWTIDSRVDLTDPNAVAATYLYASDTNELDIEWSKWAGTRSTTTVGFVAQPGGTGASFSYNIPLSNGSSHGIIDWSATSVTFMITQNGVMKKQVIYSGANNFVPGSERTSINHWLFRGAPPRDKRREKDMILSSFTFTP